MAAIASMLGVQIEDELMATTGWEDSDGSNRR